jgi:hypothetical protein
VKIIDTHNDIFKYFPNLKFDLNKWEEYSNSISPYLKDIVKEDIKKYDFEKEVFPIVTTSLSNKTAIAKIHSNFLSVTSTLEKTLSQKFNSDINVSIILYLGLCNGAGWYTKLNKENVILLGIEKIIELDWEDISSLKALIYHELGHAWHDQCRKQEDILKSVSDYSIYQLYQEGIAMTFEQTMFDNNMYFHQNRNDWLEWCLKNENNIKREYLNRLNKDINTQDFFGDWVEYKGHSDVGYFLGSQFVKYMLKSYSFTQVANINIENLKALYFEYTDR